MKSNYPAALVAVLKHEGGYVNHPNDPGGATMRGVTQAVYDAYRYRTGQTKIPVKGIMEGELQAIYKMQYWDVVRGDDLPFGLDYCVFDYAVNSGPSRAAKFLQMSLGVKADGVIGNATLDEAESADVRKTINEICDRRMVFLKALKTWGTFGKGWSSRVAGVRGLAIDMARKGAVQPAPVPPPPDVPPIETLPPKAAQKPGAKAAGGLIALVAAAVAAVWYWLTKGN